MPLTDVTKNLMIINVILYIVVYLFMQQLVPYLIFHYPTSPDFKPFQIITHMFMHAPNGQSLFSTHLLFNMIGLYFFGPPLEILWGPKRFLFYYLFTGLGAIALYTFVNFLEITYLGGRPSAALGASGAVFGLMLGFAYNYPNQTISLIFPPISLKAKYFVVILAAFELFMGVGRVDSGVAHFAHLGGALFGFLLITYWNKFGSRL